MKDFARNDPYFSLCGLNCKLCPMNISGHCGGCGFGNQSCPIARCSLEHDKPEYCFQCPEYPCGLYEHVDEYDSFITHLHQKEDMLKAKKIGTAAYTAEQSEKVKQLDKLLAGYNSGREKTLFCLAVNLLGTDDIKMVLDEGRRLDPEMPIKDKAKYISGRLREIAAERGIQLKLRKKTK